MLAKTLLILAWAPSVEAFAGLVAQRCGWCVHSRLHLIVHPIQATIYAPSWEKDGDEYCGLDEDEAPLFPSNEHSGLAEMISQGSVAALARLAAAFSPAKLDPRNIEHVEVLSIDENHVDIEAVVCDSSDGCVTLAVPISFPTPCSNMGDMEECVMDNISALDLQATSVIRQLEWEAHHHEDIDAAKRQLLALQSPTDLHYPDWWTSGGNMTSHCSSMRNLLNEDSFEEELKGLALAALSSDEECGEDCWSVDQAAVAAVCPSGLLLRAAASEMGLFDEKGETKILEIPVSFQSIASDVDELQASVLGVVAAAGAYIE